MGATSSSMTSPPLTTSKVHPVLIAVVQLFDHGRSHSSSRPGHRRYRWRGAHLPKASGHRSAPPSPASEKGLLFACLIDERRWWSRGCLCTPSVVSAQRQQVHATFPGLISMPSMVTTVSGFRAGLSWYCQTSRPACRARAAAGFVPTSCNTATLAWAGSRIREDADHLAGHPIKIGAFQDEPGQCQVGDAVPHNRRIIGTGGTLLEACMISQFVLSGKACHRQAGSTRCQRWGERGAGADINDPLDRRWRCSLPSRRYWVWPDRRKVGPLELKKAYWRLASQHRWRPNHPSAGAPI